MARPAPTTIWTNSNDYCAPDFTIYISNESKVRWIPGKAEAFIYGVGDRESCTWTGVAGSIRFEKLGKPVVYLVADNFMEDAASSAEDNGMPGLRMVGLPAHAYYKNRISRELVAPLAQDALADIIAGLTRPMSSGEIQPRSGVKHSQETIRYSAPTYEEALETFNQNFLDNHWGSGLPLIPPTPGRVQWMLTGTHRSPGEVICTVPPKNGIATVEKIAVNAVMAGARPEYLPVIIAVMEAITDKRFDLLHLTASTGSFSLNIMVNGPIVEQIGLNSGIGLLGYGFRANNTIGHAVRLCLINLGHVWPAQNDMALIGRPSSHTCQVFGENQTQSPWPPYHVLQGYTARTSCVTAYTAMSHAGPGGAFILGGGAVEFWSAQSLLNNMHLALRGARRHMALWKLESAISSPPRFMFVLHPEAAVEFHRLGYDQRKLQLVLFEECKIPVSQLTTEEIASVRRRLADGEIPETQRPLVVSALAQEGAIPLLLRPEDIHIAVAGGIPGYSFVTSYFAIPPYAETSILTKPIQER